jgi:anaerobic selenocysteine-containing dehydrogenase/ferredoxin-NADP reductase
MHALAEKRTPGFCALCKSRCGSILVTRNGRFVGQEPNPDHPTGQALCIKGKAAPELVYNRQRQLYPLKRTTPKEEKDPAWVRISWDEALDTIAKRLRRVREESGPEAVAFGWTTPSGTPISDDIRWVERFTNAFGSPNVAYGTEICNWHKDYAHAYTFGRSIASPDFEKAGCVVLWGHNPSATWLDHATATGAAHARGARLIVIDPRRAGFASRADQWLRVRPGSDGALALSIAGEMIRNGWIDWEFVRDWTNGPLLVRRDTKRFLRAGDVAAIAEGCPPDDLVAWDGAAGEPVLYSSRSRTYRNCRSVDLEASIELLSPDGKPIQCDTVFSLYRARCRDFPPERAEAICWVPANQVTETAKLLYEARPVCYYGWSGIGQHTNATQMDRAIATLMSLTGSFDAPGGNVEFAKPATRNVAGKDLISDAQRAKCIGLKRSSLGPGRDAWIGTDALYDAILHGDPYPIRALLGFGRNFLVNHANGDRGAKALAKLEFHVQTDIVMTPTASKADIFLPVNTPWEREALRVGFEGSQAAESLIQLRQAAIASLGESRSDGEIVFDLAVRLGFGHLFWDGDIRAGFDEILEPLKITTVDLLNNPNGISIPGEPDYFRYRRVGFKTLTGKIELFSEAFRDAGDDPIPTFVEPASSPYRVGGSDFPLVLTSAKVVQYCHGQHRHVPSLRKRSPDPEVSLHPDTALERGVAEGDWVEIQTRIGKARMRAKFDASLDPRVVSAQYGWWQSNEELHLPCYDWSSDAGASYNRLISDEHVDPVSGSTGLRSSMCEIVAVETPSKRAWLGWRNFEISPIGHETHDIVSFALRPTDGGELPPFRAGQHLTLRVSRENETPLVRCYSISRPTDGHRYRISVKLARGKDGYVGKMSGHLHRLSNEFPGRIELQAPKGDFHLLEWVTQSSQPIILLAGGIGITPLLSMLYELRDRHWQGSVHLFYGVRSGVDYAFRKEIEALRAELSDLKVTIYFSDPSDQDRADKVYDREGNLAIDHIVSITGPTSNFYLCGPPIMVDTMVTALEEAGIAEDHVHLEAFGPASRAKVQTSNGPQPVLLTRSEMDLLWQPDKGSLLELLEKANVKASSGCRSGQCESCIIKLAEGRVAHPDGTAEIEDGYCLPCVCVPLSPIKLEI